MDRKSDRLKSYLILGAGMAGLIALVAFAILNPEPETDERHCFTEQAPENTALIVLDTSDALIAAQPRQIAGAVEAEIARLSEGDHVVVLNAAGKAPSEVTPIVDACHPGERDNRARNAFQQTVVLPIEEHLSALTLEPEASESPLAETIVSIAADRDFNDGRSNLRVLLITDALQNTSYQSAYRWGSEFPALTGEPLKGLNIHLVLVRNERDLALQPQAVTRFVEWLEEAGASVEYAEPAWISLIASEGR